MLSLCLVLEGVEEVIEAHRLFGHDDSFCQHYVTGVWSSYAAGEAGRLKVLFETGQLDSTPAPGRSCPGKPHLFLVHATVSKN